MKIGIDISQIVYAGTGVATYTRNLVTSLLAIDKKNEYILFGSTLRRQKDLKKFTKNVWPLPPTFLDILWNRLHVLPIETFIGKLDVFHSSDWTQPPTKAKKVSTIHDLIVYKYPESSHPQIIATQKRRLNWVKKECDLIIVDSLSTKKDCQEILGIQESRLRVIYPAVSEGFKPQSNAKVSAILRKYNLRPDYILAVGTREPRKNLQRVVAAAQKTNSHLVIAGKFGWGEDIKGAQPLGYVPQEDLPALYCGAKCLVYPSLYEGFGIPVLEALACGCPVVTSKTGSLLEVAGDAAFYVNPESVEDIVEKLEVVDQSLVKKGLVQAKKFSWEKTAKETLRVYEEVVRG